MSDWLIPLIISIIITCLWIFNAYSTDEKETGQKVDREFSLLSSDGDQIFDWDFPLLVCMSWIIFSIEYDSVVAQWVAGILSGLLYLGTRRRKDVVQLKYVSIK